MILQSYLGNSLLKLTAVLFVEILENKQIRQTDKTRQLHSILPTVRKISKGEKSFKLKIQGGVVWVNRSVPLAWYQGHGIFWLSCKLLGCFWCERKVLTFFFLSSLLSVSPPSLPSSLEFPAHSFLFARNTWQESPREGLAFFWRIGQGRLPPLTMSHPEQLTAAGSALGSAGISLNSY